MTKTAKTPRQIIKTKIIFTENVLTFYPFISNFYITMRVKIDKKKSRSELVFIINLS